MPKTTVPQGHLDTNAVAERLGVSSRTVARWARAGVLPPPISGPRVGQYWSSQQIELFESARLHLADREMRDFVANALIGLTTAGGAQLISEDAAQADAKIRRNAGRPLVSVRVLRTIQLDDDAAILEGAIARVPTNVAAELIDRGLVTRDGTFLDVFDEFRSLNEKLNAVHKGLHDTMRRIVEKFEL